MELKLVNLTSKNLDDILLIVPYGIETLQEYRELVEQQRLLIVPYGIETGTFILDGCEVCSFNRTLWN